MTRDLAQIKATLAAITPRSFLEQAEENTTRPYLVWTIGDSYTELGDTAELTIEVFDYSEDATLVEAMADLVEEGLKRKNILTATELYRFTKRTRQTIPDPDAMVRRRELKYQVKIYRV